MAMGLEGVPFVLNRVMVNLHDGQGVRIFYVLVGLKLRSSLETPSLVDALPLVGFLRGFLLRAVVVSVACVSVGAARFCCPVIH